MTVADLARAITPELAIAIKGENYVVKSKTRYSLKDDASASYYKCELTNGKVLVLIPDDEVVYVGEVVPGLEYQRLSETELSHAGATYAKTGEGQQYIVEVEFGELSQVEGECTFEDFEASDSVISLGVLANGERADVLATILAPSDVTFWQQTIKDADLGLTEVATEQMDSRFATRGIIRDGDGKIALLHLAGCDYYNTVCYLAPFGKT